MVANHEGQKYHNPNCGYNPECNSVCSRVRKSYGICCGPCVSPCYTIGITQQISGWSDQKPEGLGD